MTKHFTFLFSVFLLVTSISSCNTDKDDDIELQTTIKIKVIDGVDNSNVSNMTVYAIGPQEWNLMGAGASNVAKGQVVTDSNGEAFFTVSDLPGTFLGNSDQTTLYFLVLYTRGTDNYSSHLGVTFQKGDQKIEILTLNQ